jgi:hypothetical protein
MQAVHGDAHLDNAINTAAGRSAVFVAARSFQGTLWSQLLDLA